MGAKDWKTISAENFLGELITDFALQRSLASLTPSGAAVSSCG